MGALFRTILCADWAKYPDGREVYRADCEEVSVSRELPPEAGWSVSGLIDRAQTLKNRGVVLVTFDAPIGLPKGYLAAARSVPAWRTSKTFLDWLSATRPSDGVFSAVSDPASWSPRSPFYALPPGKGTLRAWQMRLAEFAIESRRNIDCLTGAKSPFIVSGMPGTVGSAACDLWQGLIPLLGEKGQVSVWPFNASLAELSLQSKVVVGEIYPRSAYAVALASEPPEDRAPLILAKNKPEARNQAIDVLAKAAWVRAHQVRLNDLNWAQASADAFDALLTAAALLRCVVEGTPFSRAEHEDSIAEGGMLGCGSVDLTKRAKRFLVDKISSESGSGGSLGTVSNARQFACPIPGCLKVFHRSRGGWDAHVASLRTHEGWSEGIADPRERKTLFRTQYGEFFR